MRFDRMTAASALALMIAACGPQDPGEPEEIDDAPTEGEMSADVGEASGEADDAAGAGEDEAAAQRARLAAENLEASQAFLAEKREEDSVQATESGLLYEVLEEGPEDGASPIAADMVTVHYVGTLRNGDEFDSSRARGQPATFPLEQVIPGWTEGVQLMSEGDKFRFFIPPELAYGENAPPAIGPNQALIFDVELIKVQNAERNLEAANAFLADYEARDGVETTESGLRYRVLSEGDAEGIEASAGDLVTVHLRGAFANGDEFVSTYSRGAPATQRLEGKPDGLTEGVALMREGDKFEFAVPPALAYGEAGLGPVGPNQALVYEVELLEVVSPERNLARSEAFLEENAAKGDVKVTNSGLQYEVLSEGSEDGASPGADDVVEVHYRGTLIDGEEFDSSYSRGEPATFPLSGVIAGWTEGVQLMSEGDKYKFYVPAELAYGENAPPSIGPNQALIFEVELLSVVQPETDGEGDAPASAEEDGPSE